ncbi:MAG: hypothetical protein R3A11_03275 [Bdellovibrionota bacterium]
MIDIQSDEINLEKWKDFDFDIDWDDDDKVSQRGEGLTWQGAGHQHRIFERKSRFSSQRTPGRSFFGLRMLDKKATEKFKEVLDRKTSIFPILEAFDVRSRFPMMFRFM